MSQSQFLNDSITNRTHNHTLVTTVNGSTIMSPGWSNLCVVRELTEPNENHPKLRKPYETGNYDQTLGGRSKKVIFENKLIILTTKVKRHFEESVLREVNEGITIQICRMIP